MNFIGLDIGTTGCKASVIDENGVTIYSRYSEYNLVFPRNGWVEINANMVWDKVCEVLSDVAGNCGESKFDAIAVGSFGESVVLLDKDDEVIGNSIFFTDIRGTEEIKLILSRFDQSELQSITGMPLNSMYSLNKLLWIQKHEPERIARAKRIMLFSDYIGYKLTGKAFIDYSMASRTMMFDTHEKKWSAKIFDTFNFNMNAFSTPAQSGTIVGRILPSVAEQLMLNDTLTLVLGAHDQACAAVGSGAVRNGDAVNSIGSAECITVVVDPEKADQNLYKYNFCCEPHAAEGKYITLAFQSTAGASLKWYRDTFEYDRYKKLKEQNIDIYQVLDSECDDNPTDLFFLPHLAGSGTPMMDSSSKGAFLGLTLGTTKNQMYKSIIEGICFESRINVDLLKECGIEINRLVSVGGGSKSANLLRIKSNVLGRSVCTLEAPEAGAMGLAVICAHALKVYEKIEQATAAMVKIKNKIHPDTEMHKAYTSRYETYRKIYPLLKKIGGT